MRMKKLLVTLIISAFCSILANAQPQHVRWTYESKAISGNLFEISITVTPDPGWHVYDTLKTDFGPSATVVSIDTAGGVKVVEGPEVDGKLHKTYDTFTHKVDVPSGVESVSANLEWMSCNNVNCDRPAQETMEIRVR